MEYGKWKEVQLLLDICGERSQMIIAEQSDNESEEEERGNKE